MKFQLNEYHQNIPDDELLEDVKKVSKIVGDEYLSIRKYEEYGKYREGVFRNRFGSWLNVLKKLGLRTNRNPNEMKRISTMMIVSDLKDVAEKLNKSRITSTEYEEFGKYSMPTIKDRFGSWAKFIEKAGLEQTGFVCRVDTVELFNEIERIWIALGKQPTTTDMKKGISKFSLDTFTRRFGGWRNALKTFLDYVENDDDILNEQGDEDKVENTNEEIRSPEKEDIKIKIKRTSRNINLKLRFKVLVRDNFTCCYCGASPAKDPKVELHVDHVIPWSKGGETILENLKTSCSKCNLGKGNMEHD